MIIEERRFRAERRDEEHQSAHHQRPIYERISGSRPLAAAPLRTSRSEYVLALFFSSRRRHTRYWRDWSSDVCSSDLTVSPGYNTCYIRERPCAFCANCRRVRSLNSWREAWSTFCRIRTARRSLRKSGFTDRKSVV